MTAANSTLHIRSFQPGDEVAFRRLNEEWILRHFVLEPADVAYLSDPQGMILNKGGRLFLAEQEGACMGCCALIAMGPGEFEVSKMAVTEACRGTGIGRCLLAHVITEARHLGARRLYLETNASLTPAIRLYESFGFQRLPPAQASPYARANVFMELLLGD